MDDFKPSIEFDNNSTVSNIKTLPIGNIQRQQTSQARQTINKPVQQQSRPVKPVAQQPIKPQKPTYTLESQRNKVYSRFDFEREVFGTNVGDFIEILNYKKNIILQGSPGVGKTYTAKRLAWAILGEKDENRIVQVQFHQSYSYEDFVIGLRPTEDGGFKFEHGPFYNICKLAEKDPEHKPFFIIIDEINRGNMSKVLGEGFSLIEKDHRNEKIMLKYGGELFSVPDNLYIIGTMNTADRGLVMLDYALRRRFAFITVEPKFRSEGFRQLLNTTNNIKFNRIVREIVNLNIEICKDEMLGDGFQIGHSYFCIRERLTDNTLSNIIKFEIMPLLQEYWYDSPEKIRKWQEKFNKILETNN